MFHLQAVLSKVTTTELKVLWNKKHLNHVKEDRTVKFQILRYYKCWRTLQKGSQKTSAKEIEKQKKFSNSLRNLFDIEKQHKPNNIVEQQASCYLQGQREQANLQSTSEPGLTETISCSVFEETEKNLEQTTFWLHLTLNHHHKLT